LKIDNTKEEVTMILKTSEKNNKTEMQNKMEGHTRRLEQAEDRISELENEILNK
jgi:predicted transcriptional regulator